MGRLLGLLCCWAVLWTARTSAADFGSGVVYQGQLKNAGVPANGLFEMAFELFPTLTGGSSISQATTNSIAVSNGLFTTTLDFGPAAFDGNERYLAISVRPAGSTNAFETLNPRQAITPTPHALVAGTANNIAGIAGTNLATLSGSNYFAGPVTFGNGINIPGTNRVANLNADMLDGLDSSAFWKLGGNIAPSNGAVLGTINNERVQIRVGGNTVLRLEPAAGPPNVALGSGHVLSDGVTASTISGGSTHTIGQQFGTIAGGSFNRLTNGTHGTISGGSANINAAAGATIAGGFNNAVWANGFASTVGGGAYNTNNGYMSVVAGGQFNTMNGGYGTIAGGYSNSLTGGWNGAISGGEQNTAAGTYSGIGSGFKNNNSGGAGYIGGGERNTNSGYANVVGGGLLNSVGPGQLSFLGGGNGNSILDSSQFSAIAGGQLNSIRSNAQYSFIGGGSGNLVETNAHGVIVGGAGNRMASAGGFIGGGAQNVVAAGNHGVVVGGSGNLVVTGQQAVVVGGQWNRSSGDQSFVGAGIGNRADNNRASVAGGWYNGAEGDSSTVGGGVVNVAAGYASTVPGGYANRAAGDFSFAAGANAKALHNGSFVWSDVSGGDFASTGPNQFYARATGGVLFGNTNASPFQSYFNVVSDNLLMFSGSSSSQFGTWLNMINTSSNGRAWTMISSGSGNSEGSGKLLIHEGYGGGNTVMTLQADGNVGLGTSFPEARLHVGGPSILGDHTRIGGLSNAPTATSNGWGKALIFSGAPDVGTSDNDNSDPLWMARFNAGDNRSELRMIIGDDSTGFSDKFVVGTFGTGNPNFGQTGTWTPRFSVDSVGAVRAAGTFVANTSPDLAETIPAAGDVEAGDIVCADPSARERAIRGSKNDRGFLGVIADGKGGFLINAHGESPDAPLTGKPLVLAGRVPVKVSLENGPIRIGDTLAPSSTPGVAMRASAGSATVGIALESYDGTQKAEGAPKVLCFVKAAEAAPAMVTKQLQAELKARDARIAELEAQVADLAKVKASFAEKLAEIEKVVTRMERREQPVLSAGFTK